jgi:hypothetical protein
MRHSAAWGQTMATASSPVTEGRNEPAGETESLLTDRRPAQGYKLEGFGCNDLAIVGGGNLVENS